MKTVVVRMQVVGDTLVVKRERGVVWWVLE